MPKRRAPNIWVKIQSNAGNSDDAWFDSKRLNKHRKLLKCERKAVANPTNPKTFYLVGVENIFLVGKYPPRYPVMDRQ